MENGSVKAECYAEEGKLIVQILAADDKKQEALTLSDYTLDAENGALEVGSGVHYGLYADYADANGKAERMKVVENFVDANFGNLDQNKLGDNHSCRRGFYLFRRRQDRVGYPAYLSKSGYTMLPLRAAVRRLTVSRPKLIGTQGERGHHSEGRCLLSNESRRERCFMVAIHWKPRGN